jgi:hypothetical protein
MFGQTKVIIIFALIICYSIHTVSDEVPPPAVSLESNFNYFFQNNGNILEDVHVIVEIDEDFVSLGNGVGFQLNCYSPLNRKSVIVWQQFVIAMTVDNFLVRVVNA